MADIPWGPEWLKREIEENPLMENSNRAKLLVIDDWNELRIVEPSRIFTDQMTFVVDGITLQLQWVGGPHASDSITVEVPEDTVNWDMLNRLPKDSIQWYVHGHFNGGKSEAGKQPGETSTVWSVCFSENFFS